MQRYDAYSKLIERSTKAVLRCVVQPLCASVRFSYRIVSYFLEAWQNYIAWGFELWGIMIILKELCQSKIIFFLNITYESCNHVILRKSQNPNISSVEFSTSSPWILSFERYSQMTHIVENYVIYLLFHKFLALNKC